MTYNQSYVAPQGDSNVSLSNCLPLTVDSTAITFFGETCSRVPSSVNLGGGVATATNISVLEADGIYIQNPILHTWKNATGDLGLSYCLGATCSTSFQQTLLQATSSLSTNNQTFGLDFRDPNSTIASIASSSSSMQLGGVSATYQDQLTWSEMPTPGSTYYHQFMLNDLSFCGINMLANISRTYPVLVDTGSSCLTLPAEIYNHFTAWLYNSTVVMSPELLPAFSFKLVGNDGQMSEELFIPLSTLLVSLGSIEKEAGAPFIEVQENINGVSVTHQKRICVLKGAEIGHPYNYPAPLIVFGALTLQSLYFAADFETFALGLANKLSPTDTAYYQQNRQYCAAAVQCTGGQSFVPAKNYCKPPRCDQYFFSEVDPATQTCVASASPYYFGIIFLAVIVLMEVISFFVGQYSGYMLSQGSSHGANGAQRNGGGGGSVGGDGTSRNGPGGRIWQAEKTPLYQLPLPTGPFRVGYATLYVGKFFSQLLDVVFQFALPPPPPAAPAQVAMNPAAHLPPLDDAAAAQQLRRRAAGPAGAAVGPGGAVAVEPHDEEVGRLHR